MPIDFGKTAEDYARHRAGFPPALFDRLAGFGVGQPGQRVLDVGTGTGTLARGFAMRGCEVTGLDPAAPLLKQAADLDREAGVSVRYAIGTAESTGMPAASFDGVSAGQCWHWFDRPRAAQEIRRVLIPGGWLVIAHFDWIPLPSNIAAATERLIEQHNPAWGFGGGLGLHPAWLYDLGVAGFDAIESFSFDVAAPYTHEGWCGRIRASAGVAASLPPDAVARFDADLRALLAQRFPEEPLQVPHRVFAVVARTPR